MHVTLGPPTALMYSMSTWLSFLAWVPLAFVGVTLLHADEFTSDGVKIHYLIEGKGEPVILIHGLYATATGNWQGPGIMPELAKNYQVIALDLRAHGQSGKPEILWRRSGRDFESQHAGHVSPLGVGASQRIAGVPVF